jgi:hypothetical protein
MRYPASEKAEIIELVEQSHLRQRDGCAQTVDAPRPEHAGLQPEDQKTASRLGEAVVARRSRVPREIRGRETAPSFIQRDSGGFMRDEETVARAILDIELILGNYLHPGDRDPNKTIEEIIEMLDRRDVIAAAKRLESGHGLRVIK